MFFDDDETELLRIAEEALPCNNPRRVEQQPVEPDPHTASHADHNNGTGMRSIDDLPAALWNLRRGRGRALGIVR
jgi:hypothetical protein